MATAIVTTRSDLRRLGWSLHERLFVSLDGRRLHLVYCRRGKQSFSASGSTRQRAWTAAAQLTGCLRPDGAESTAIVRFPAGGLSEAWRREYRAAQEAVS